MSFSFVDIMLQNGRRKITDICCDHLKRLSRLIPFRCKCLARFDAAATDEERDLIEYDYKMWKKNFPLSLTGDSSKARLDWQIKELQKRRKELDDEDTSE